MKYIYRKFVKDIDLSELDFINQDEILGNNPDGHDYDLITVKPEGREGYYDESEEINIDTAIEALQELKKAGATHAQILAHVDHHGYEFYGLEMRKATKEEVAEYKEDEKAFIKKQNEEKIAKLKKEIEQLEK